MIIRVLPTGKDAAGLTRYLFGPGKANDHTNQRMIAGSPVLHAEWGETALTMKQATYVGRLLESAWRRQYAPELAMAGQGAGGISRANLASGEDAVPGQTHVFHATLSLRADEQPLTDEQWRTVAETYLQKMGYIGNPEHPDATWMAVHHGVSANGNDHIHIAMCTTLRDGSSVDVHNSGIRSQQEPRAAIEALPFVNALHDRGRSKSAPAMKGFTAAEHNIARARSASGTGSEVPDRVQLQRIVAAAAAQSRTEAEFINAVTANRGVSIEAARWEPGTRNVTGYRVGLDDGPMFPASKLSSQLTLQKLRRGWSETPESAQLARDLWAEDTSKLDKLTRTRNVPEQLEAAEQALEQFNTHLAGLDPHDRAGWAHAESGLAGTAAVLATGRPQTFRQHGGRAADVLARQAMADMWANPGPAAPHVPTGASGAEIATRHVQLALRASSTDRHAGWLAVIQQINRATTAIADAAKARGEEAAWRGLQQQAVPAMQQLHDALSTTATAAPASTPAVGQVERESERLLRERSTDQTSGGTVAEANEMTDAARAAKAAADHGRAGTGISPAPGPGGGTGRDTGGQPRPAQTQDQDHDKKQGRGRR